MKLYNYQIEGCEFLLAERRCILADDMGLGKTVQALNAAVVDSEPIIVVCPKVLIPEWRRAIKEWKLNLTVYLLQEHTQEELSDLLKQKHTIGIVNYARVSRYTEFLCSKNLGTLIVDEAHKVKNRKAQRSRSVSLIARRSEKVFLLTGTPPLDKPQDMWHLLHILDHKKYSSYWRWFDRYVSFWLLHGKTKVPSGGILDKPSYTKEISPYFLRRCRDDLKPVLHICDCVVELSESHQNIYNRIRNDELKNSDGRGLSFSNILHKILTLRRIATSPYSLHESLDQGSSKIEYLIEKLPPTQFVVFSHFINSNRLVLNSIPNITDDIKAWKAEEYQGLALSYSKDSHGLNLQQATDCFLLEPPAGGSIIFQQAIKRIHRLGTGVKFIWLLTALNTVDVKYFSMLKNSQRVFKETEIAIEVWKDVLKNE